MSIIRDHWYDIRCPEAPPSGTVALSNTDQESIGSLGNISVAATAVMSVFYCTALTVISIKRAIMFFDVFAVEYSSCTPLQFLSPLDVYLWTLGRYLDQCDVSKGEYMCAWL